MSMTLLFFLISVLLSGILYFVRNKTLNHYMTWLYNCFVIFFVYNRFIHKGETELMHFEADSLGLIFLILLAIISIFTAFHYKIYADRRNEGAEAVAIHNSIFVLFIAALSGAVLCNHFGLLWAFLEATTLTGAILIYHDRSKLAIEAVWKYVFVGSVSIAIAFAGILFLALAAEVRHTHIDLSFKTISEISSTLDPMWLKGCFLFILTGFSVKMGVVPMFNINIDAKDISPSPVGAMFSSVLLNAGFLAIFRFYSAFAGTSILPWMNHVLIITGVLSILISAIFLTRVKNYKRIFAYHTVEHAGLVILALGMGKNGYYAAILHLIMYVLIKSSLFFQMGEIERIYKSKQEGVIGGYFAVNPLGGFVIIIGLLSLIAFPPSGLFMSELLMFKAYFSSGKIWLAVIVMLLLTVIVFTLSSALLKLLFKKPAEHINSKEAGISYWHSVPQVLLLAASIYIGFVQPAFVTDLINSAIQTIP